MAVIAAFKDAGAAIRQHPRLLLAGLGVAVVGHLLTVGEMAHESLTAGLTIIGWICAFPFLLGGFLGVAQAAIHDAEVTLGRFLRAGRGNYLRMLLAMLLLIAVVIGGMFVALLGGFLFSVTTIAVLAVAGLTEQVAFGAGAFVLIALPLLAFAGVVVLAAGVQFYGAAIVIERQSPRGAFERSMTVVKENLRSGVGFTILWGLLTHTFLESRYLLAGILSTSGLRQVVAGISSQPSIISTPLVILQTAVAFTYLYAVYTAFYLRLTGETPETIANQGPTEPTNA